MFNVNEKLTVKVLGYDINLVDMTVKGRGSNKYVRFVNTIILDNSEDVVSLVTTNC